MKRREYLKAERKIYDKYSSPYARRQREAQKKADAMRKELGVEDLFKAQMQMHLKPETEEFLKKHGS